MGLDLAAPELRAAAGKRPWERPEEYWPRLADATADLLTALAADPDAGYPLAEMAETAGTRFGIEVVRLAERNAWTLE